MQNMEQQKRVLFGTMPDGTAVEAVTLDTMFGGAATDYSPIAALCRELGVPLQPFVHGEF